jgi:hypothetical protein
LKVPSSGETIDLDIRIDLVRVAGVPDPDILGVQHTVTLPINAHIFFDRINPLNYTDLVDKFTYLVKQVGEQDTEHVVDDKDNTNDLSWFHVAYTADKLAFFMNHRDFLTADFVSEPHLLINSRSCIHPECPTTPEPTVWALTYKDRRIYRSPLQYFQRMIPDANDNNSCTVVQFQFSDVGGFVPSKEQTKAVVQFGIDNIPKDVSTILTAVSQGVQLGPGTPGYLDNPLIPRWRQSPKEMIPGLR